LNIELQKLVIDALENQDIPLHSKIEIITLVSGKSVTKDSIKNAIKFHALGTNTDLHIHNIGILGNVWVRKQYYPQKEVNHKGHKHNFDHVSLLAVGSLQVTVEGYPPKIFHAPDFFIVKKDHYHNLLPLTDGVVAYCIFAVRDDAGNVSDMYSGNNTPFGVDSAAEEKDRVELLAKLEAETVIK